MTDYPIYYKNERIKYRSSPKELKEVILQYYPLTKEFIDWVVKEGFKIQYIPYWKGDRGAVLWSLRRILLGSQGEKKSIEKTLVHEIVHILIPGVPCSTERWETKEEFEKAIDEVADIYFDDLELMEYIRLRILVFQDDKEST